MKSVQGNQPINESYTLTITVPSTVPIGSALSIPLNISVLSKPAGVDDATALSFITLTPSALSVTGPNQLKPVTVTVAVPIGNYSGDYSYRILTSGWPANLSPAPADLGATINVYVAPTGSTDTTPPAVTMQSPGDGTSYSYYPPGGPALAVPVVFEASVGPNGQPIDSMKAYIGSEPIVLTTTGLGTLAASATGTASISAAGNYTIRVEATNQNGTSEASADITVSTAPPPPTITVASPTPNAEFTYLVGGTGVAVPVSFTATSLYGDVTSVAASLNGTPVILSTSPTGASVTGSATLNLTAGNYTLVFNAQNVIGAATPVSVPFIVRTQAPTPVLPTVAIVTPANGAVFTRVEGDPATTVNFSFTAGTTAGAIASVTVTLDGALQTAAVVGLNTAAVTGSGALSFSAGGNHSLSVTATNGDGATTATTTFTVQQTPASVCQNLIWLPPVSLNKTVEGGSTVPVKFVLTCGSNFIRDTTTRIAIYEIYSDGSASEPAIFAYGAGSNPNPPDYAILGNHYHLNFKTATGVHRYRIEVYHPLTNSTFQLLGAKELLTKQGRRDGHGDDDDNSCDDDDRGDHGRDHDKDRDDKGRGKK